jgi:hypothetical protein
MGGLIPSGNDAEVIDKLNTTFQGAKLAKLRKHIRDNADDFFASNRQLHRISHRLKIFPTSGQRPKGRWYVFLRDLIGDANRIQILQALRDSVGDPDCVGIHFWARFNTRPSPPDYEVEISPKHPDANGKFWMTITLLCDHEIDAGIQGDPSDPPADGDEHGPVHPNLRPTKAKSAKKYVKKAVKKAPKKAVRKGAKKKK